MSKKQNLYYWSGLDDQGNRTCGSHRAASVPLLKHQLLKENILSNKIDKQNLHLIQVKQWLNSKHTVFFLSQLAAMLKTGINLNKTILILKENQTEKRFSRLYEDVYRRLNIGKSLSQTLENYPLFFDDITLHIIKSGELTGHTDKAIAQARDYLEKKLRTLNELLTALLYPLILGLVTLAVLSVMMVFVIPQFETLYSGSNNPLPLLTRTVLSISGFIRTNLDGFLFSLLFFYMILKLLKHLTQIELICLVPGLNRTLTQANTLRLCQTLNNLYCCGLPITQALKLCKNLSTSTRYQNAMTQTLAKIHQGVELAQALHETGYFEPTFIQLIKTGEQAASLSNMLDQCAQFYEKQLTDSLARLKIILEPLLIVILGTIIGIILIAMYLPVFNIGTSF